MIKPEEIKSVTFEQSVFSGYKKEDVDAFLDKLYVEYSRMYAENGELVGKLKVCVKKIEEYREDEKFLKSAIVNAQKLNETALNEIESKRKETEENARNQAEEILSQAKDQAARLVDEANSKIAEFREKTTREFAEKQQDSIRAYEAQKVELDEKIKAKMAEFTALSDEVEAFRLRAMQVLEQQADLLRDLPVAPTKVEEYRATINVSEKEEAPVVDEPAATDLFIEEATAEEPVVGQEMTVEESSVLNESEAEETVIENVEDSADESAVTDPVSDVSVPPHVEDGEDETDTDTEETKDEEVSDDEQISFDEVIVAQPSPVEHTAPVLAAEEEEEEAEDGGFQFFGGSPLIFPQDISDSEDEEDDKENDKEKNPRFRKKLKFGVDFDVKKDK